MPNRFEPGQSRLLNLPGEIRNKIWESVLGNQTVHIHKVVRWDPYSWSLHNCLCVEEKSEDDAYAMATSNDPDKEYFEYKSEFFSKYAYKTNEALFDRHTMCTLCPAQPKLHLDLLRVCRQIYFETSLTPYKTNTFLFGVPEAWATWSATRTFVQRRALTAIGMDIDWTDEEDIDDDDEIGGDLIGDNGPQISWWNAELIPCLVAELTGLKKLHLHFRAAFDDPFESSVLASADTGWNAESFLFFSQLMLPQSGVTVIVSTSDAEEDHALEEVEEEDEDNGPPTLALKARQRIAEQMRQFLLGNDDGREVNKFLDILKKDPYQISSAWRFFKARQHEAFWQLMSEHLHN
jgi:hypothetical protein